MALALGFLLSLPTAVYAEGEFRRSAAILTLTEDDNCISVDQTTAGAAALTITGACASGGVATITATPLTKVAQQVSIEGSGNNSGITFTICGTDADSKTRATCEVLTGSNGGTATSAQWYSTVTSITASGAVTGNVEAGWLEASGGVTETIVLNYDGYSDDVNITVDVTGTVPYTVENTGQKMSSKFEPLWFDTLDLSTQTTDLQGNFGVAVGGVRLRCTSAVCVANLMTVQGVSGR